MAKYLLVTRPEHDYSTRYLSAWAKRFFALFLDPSNLVVTTLLKGHPTQDAVSRARQEFLRKIQTLLTSEARADEYSTLRYLVWDMKNLVLCGKADKKLF